MCDFKPGDEVVCIRGEHRPDPRFRYPDVPRLITGATYTIREIVECRASDGTDEGIGVTLHEVRWTTLHGPEGAYCASRFRKAERRNIEAWLETATDFEEPKRAKEPAQ